MLLEPKSTQNIIVGTLVEDNFKWFVTEKDLWFMDYEKRRNDYKNKIKKYNLHYDMDTHIINNERKDIDILNEFTIGKFINNIQMYKVTTDELRELVELSLVIDGKKITYFNFLPSLYLDFDNRELYSLYSEYESFEAYVPNNWIGIYEDFLNKIDTRYQFWKDKKGSYIVDFSKGGIGLE